MYGKNAYGTIQYASTAPSGAEDEYYVDLTTLVPPFVAEKLEMHELYVSQGYEIGRLQHSIEDVIDQCFITTATWGLTRWEQIFGVSTNLSLSYEQRREILMAKLRGQGTTTKQMIQDVAEAFSGGEVVIIEDNPHSRFLVRFVGIKGIPRNMQGFISMLEEIKPAHLAYEFEYRYTTWEELNKYKWSGIKGMTWEEARVMKEA